MTTHYDRLKAAWETDAPLSLDRAAEQLAAEGVVESEIMDALERLLLEVRAAGADDETEERIMGVYDRLTGWCLESNHIRTARTTPASGPVPTSIQVEADQAARDFHDGVAGPRELPATAGLSPE